MNRHLSFDSLEHRRLCSGDVDPNWDPYIGWFPSEEIMTDPTDVFNYPTYRIAPPLNPLDDPTVYPRVPGLDPMPRPYSGDLLNDFPM